MRLLQKLNKSLVTLTNIFPVIMLLMAGLFISSCENSLEANNKNFLLRYGSQVDKINRAREDTVRTHIAKQQARGWPKPAIWKEPAKLIDIDGTNYAKSAFVDTTVLKVKEPPTPFLPDLQTFYEGKNLQRTVPTIQDVVYVAANFPKTYKTQTISFDDIKIPKHDFFGVKSKLEDKQYNLVDHKVLQQNVDYMNENLNLENRKINLTLLKERESIRKQKYHEMFILQKEKELRKINGNSIENAQQIVEDIMLDILMDDSLTAPQKVATPQPSVANTTAAQRPQPDTIVLTNPEDNVLSSPVQEGEIGLPPLPSPF